MVSSDSEGFILRVNHPDMTFLQVTMKQNKKRKILIQATSSSWNLEDSYSPNSHLNASWEDENWHYHGIYACTSCLAFITHCFPLLKLYLLSRSRQGGWPWYSLRTCHRVWKGRPHSRDPKYKTWRDSRAVPTLNKDLGLEFIKSLCCFENTTQDKRPPGAVTPWHNFLYAQARVKQCWVQQGVCLSTCF